MTRPNTTQLSPVARGSSTVRIALVVASIIAALVAVHSLAGLLRAQYAPVPAFSANQSTPASVDAAISTYVVGPSSLAGEVRARLPNAKLIQPSFIGSIPAGSVVIVDLGYLEGCVGGDGAIIDLSSLLRDGDLVVIYANDSRLAAYELGRAWASANGIEFTAVPTLVGGGMVAAFGDGDRLVYMTLRGLAGLYGAVIEYIRLGQAWRGSPGIALSPIAASLQSSSQATAPDPCYQYETGEGGNGVTIDYLPDYNDVPGEAFSDGNGTFYYDTCVFVYDGVFKAASGLPYMYVDPAVWIAYAPSSAMVRGLGRIDYYVGTIDHEAGYREYKEGITNSFISYFDYYDPGSTGSGAYVSSFNVGFTLAGPSVGFTLTYVESPSSVNVDYRNAGGTQGFDVNNTWRFSFFGSPSSGQQYGVASTDDSTWSLMQGVESTNAAALDNEIGVNLVTSIQYYPCTAVYSHEYIYVDAGWILYYDPGQSPTGSAVSSSPAARDPYITGITSYSQSTSLLCGT